MIYTLDGNILMQVAQHGRIKTFVHLDENMQPIQIGWTVYGKPRYQKSIIGRRLNEIVPYESEPVQLSLI